MTQYQPLSTRDMRILAATIHYEAGGEPVLGMAAVAQVILNRAFDGRRGWVGKGVGPVERACFAPHQFSCWNDDRAGKLTDLFIAGDPDRGWVSDSVARGSRDGLRAFLAGDVDPRVEECSHYINPTTAPIVGNALTGWGSRWKEGHHIGRHTFLEPSMLTPRERAVDPVIIESAPAIRLEDVHWFLAKLARFKNWLIAAAGTAGFTLIEYVTNIVQQVKAMASGIDLPDLPLTIILGGAVILVGVAYIFWQRKKDRDYGNPKRTQNPRRGKVGNDHARQAGHAVPANRDHTGGGVNHGEHGRPEPELVRNTNARNSDLWQRLHAR